MIPPSRSGFKCRKLPISRRTSARKSTCRYNPIKPGRPSHNYHSYFIGRARIALGVDVRPGKQHSDGCGVVKQAESDFVKDLTGREWDYCALVTNDETHDATALSQLYRDRGDPEAKPRG